MSRRGTGLVRAGLDSLYLACGWLAGMFLVVILGLMMTLSLGRQFGLNVPSGDDFAAWSMAALSFLSLAYTFRSGEIIRIGLVLDRLDGRTRRAVEIACLLLGAALVGFFAWHAVRMNYDSWRFDDISQGVVAVRSGFRNSGTRRPRRPVHRLCGRTGSRASRPPSPLREAEAKDGRRGDRARNREWRLMFGDLGLVGTAAILLALLLALLAGGLWIGLALLAVGFAAMTIVANVPIGSVLATTVWASSASGPSRPYRSSSGWARSCSGRASRNRCFTASRLGCNGSRAGSCT
jgi:hypothetical protein